MTTEGHVGQASYANAAAALAGRVLDAVHATAEVGLARFLDTCADATVGLGAVRVVGADVFVEYPLANDQEVIFQTNVFRYFQGRDNAPSGFGLFSEVGYRFGPLEPLVSVEYFNADVAHTDFLTLRPGLNFWVMKHTVNLKAEVAVGRQQVPATNTPTTSVVGTAQLQVFY